MSMHNVTKIVNAKVRLPEGREQEVIDDLGSAGFIWLGGKNLRERKVSPVPNFLFFNEDGRVGYVNDGDEAFFSDHAFREIALQISREVRVSVYESNETIAINGKLYSKAEVIARMTGAEELV